MCTVTFLSDKEGGFILTSNRDEKILRARAELPSVSIIHDQKILFPKDPKAGGTWIALSESGRAVCLLNGAFEAHIPVPPYRKSRGLVLLDNFQFADPADFFSQYDFEGIESFTLILTENKQLWEFRWDGKNKHLYPLIYSQSYIWASSTLYSEEVRGKRKQWFREWLAKNRATIDGIRQFHRFSGEGDPQNDIVINREGLMQTLSITSIHHSASTREMIYEDLLENKTYISQF